MIPRQLILSYFRRAKRRTGFLLLSIFIAFFLYGTLAGTHRVINPSVGMSDELIVRNRVNLMQSLPVAHRDRIASVDHVRAVTSTSLFGGYYRERVNPLPTIMVDGPSYLADFAGDLALSVASRKAFLDRRDGILIDSDAARRYGLAIGDRLPLTSQIHPLRNGQTQLTFVVQGIYDLAASNGASGGIAHYQYLNEHLAGARDRVHWFLIRTDAAANNDRVASDIDALFRNSSYQTRTEPAAAMAKAFLGQLGDLNLMIFAIVGASLATLAMIMGNSIALAVRRRARDMAVLRTIGFSELSIGAGICLEVALLFTIGGAAGLLAAGAAVSVLAAELTGQPTAWSLLPAPVLAGGLLLICVMTLLTSVLPAVRAMRMSPAAAFARS